MLIPLLIHRRFKIIKCTFSCQTTFKIFSPTIYVENSQNWVYKCYSWDGSKSDYNIWLGYMIGYDHWSKLEFDWLR